MKKRYDKSTMIGRAVIAFECTSLAQLAKIFDLFPQDLSNRIRRETFLELIENEAKKRNINLDWIKTGSGSMIVTEPILVNDRTDNLPIYSSYMEKFLFLHQQLEHICRDGSENQISMVAAVLKGAEQSVMQFKAIMAEILKLSDKIDKLESDLKSEGRIPGATSQDNQTRRNAK